MKMNVYVLFLVFLVSVTDAAKILGIFMVPSYSHQRVYQPIWRELSLRGHDVTVYTPNPLNDPTLTNLTEIDLSFSYDRLVNMSTNVFMKTSRLEEAQALFKAFSAMFNYQMSSPEMQKLLANENKDKYDLFLVEYLYPSMYPFKDVFNCPMVGITSLPLTAAAAAALGMSKHPVLDPDFFLPFSTDLSFRERVTSTVMFMLTKVFSPLKMGPLFNAEAKKYFGENTRDILGMMKEVSLVLGNFNYVTQNIRPQVPAFVEIPGLHLQPEQPLPQDLKQFLDEADEGVVYFSLGSNVKSSELPSTLLDTFLAAFSELPYKVLFKFETDSLRNCSSVPSNVEIRKWVSQQDVLRHRNVKIFVTQGGLQSIDESLNGKVPMLIIPVLGDQYFNAHKMVSAGAALSMDYSDFSKEELVEKITRVIQDPQYKETVTKLGAIAFDHQGSPLEKAVWWIEYVIRHKGADHLKYKAVNMPFYQFYLLDVYSFLGAIIGATSYVLFKFYKLFITGVKTAKAWKSVNLKKSQ